MINGAFGVFTLFFALFCSVSTFSADSPAELYGKGRAVQSLALSPDGERIAYLTSVDGVDGLVVSAVDGRDGFRLPSPELKLRSVEWSGPNHVLLYASETQTNYGFRDPNIEFWGVFSVDVRNRELVQLLARNRNMDLQGSLADVRAKTWDENGTVYMAARTSNLGRSDPSLGVIGYSRGNVDLYEVDGNTGRGSRISKGSENTDQWIVRPDGRVVARVDFLNKTNRYRVLAPEGGVIGRNWDTIFSEETEIPNMSIYGTTQSGDSLVFGTRYTTDRYALFTMSTSDGAIAPTALYEHEYVDVSSIIVDDYTGEVVGAEITYAAREQQFFQGQFVAVVNAVKQALPEGHRVYLESWDMDRKKFVLFAQSNTNAGMYLLMNVETGNLDVIARAHPDLTPVHLSPVSPFVYQTRDGVNIQGYLTVPANTKAENLPLVVMPHGGPEARDELRYDWWQQFMASRGYAVVQMNFRGSSGYGVGFSAAGYREYGGVMQDDVTDAVHHLIEEGIADPSRICIVGGSYGGYAALAGAAYTPDLYKCAVSYSGLSDLNLKMSWVRKRWGVKSWIYEYWVSRMGEPGDDLKARSPAHAADQITADILLIHGKDDTVVDLEQSEVMAEALKDAGKSYAFIVLDGEDHWLSTDSTRIAMLEALDEFLAKHLWTDSPEQDTAAANQTDT